MERDRDSEIENCERMWRCGNGVGGNNCSCHVDALKWKRQIPH